MADAGAGLDAGHGCVLDAGADQPGPAAGDQQIDQPVRGHQLVGAGVGGVLNEAHRALRQAHPAQTGAQSLHDGVAAGPGVAPAAQDARAARLDGQRGGVARDVGAALVDDGDDTHRHGGFLDQKAVRTHNFAQHRAHRVGQGRDLAHTLGHVGQAARRQRQTVQHHVADPPAGVLDVLLIGGQNFILRGDERDGHRLQRGVLRVGVGQRQRQLCALRGLQNFLRSHGVRPPLCLAAHKPGADGLALDNVVQHLGVGTVGNDHVHTGLGGALGGGDLRQHAAGAKRRARAARQQLNFRRDLLDHRDELCIRVGVRVGGVQAVDVGHQHDQIGVDALGHQRGQRVVVAQRVFLAGDGVVLVDDGDGVQLQKTFQRILQVFAAQLVVEVLPREQHLRDGMVVLAEQPVVGVHQLALADRRSGLLGGDVAGFVDLQLAHAETGGRRRDNNELMPGVLDVTPHLDEVFCVADIEQPAGMRQRAGSNFDDNTHKLLLP